MGMTLLKILNQNTLMKKNNYASGICLRGSFKWLATLLAHATLDNAAFAYDSLNYGKSHKKQVATEEAQGKDMGGVDDIQRMDESAERALAAMTEWGEEFTDANKNKFKITLKENSQERFYASGDEDFQGDIEMYLQKNPLNDGKGFVFSISGAWKDPKTKAEKDQLIDHYMALAQVDGKTVFCDLNTGIWTFDEGDDIGAELEKYIARVYNRWEHKSSNFVPMSADDVTEIFRSDKRDFPPTMELMKEPLRRPDLIEPLLNIDRDMKWSGLESAKAAYAEMSWDELTKENEALEKRIERIQYCLDWPTPKTANLIPKEDRGRLSKEIEALKALMLQIDLRKQASSLAKSTSSAMATTETGESSTQGAEIEAANQTRWQLQIKTGVWKVEGPDQPSDVFFARFPAMADGQEAVNFCPLFAMAHAFMDKEKFSIADIKRIARLYEETAMILRKSKTSLKWPPYVTDEEFSNGIAKYIEALPELGVAPLVFLHALSYENGFTFKGAYAAKTEMGLECPMLKDLPGEEGRKLSAWLADCDTAIISIPAAGWWRAKQPKKHSELWRDNSESTTWSFVDANGDTQVLSSGAHYGVLKKLGGKWHYYFDPNMNSIKPIDLATFEATAPAKLEINALKPSTWSGHLTVAEMLNNELLLATVPTVFDLACKFGVQLTTYKPPERNTSLIDSIDANDDEICALLYLQHMADIRLEKGGLPSLLGDATPASEGIDEAKRQLEAHAHFKMGWGCYYRLEKGDDNIERGVLRDARGRQLDAPAADIDGQPMQENILYNERGEPLEAWRNLNVLKSALDSERRRLSQSIGLQDIVETEQSKQAHSMSMAGALYSIAQDVPGLIPAIIEEAKSLKQEDRAALFLALKNAMPPGVSSAADQAAYIKSQIGAYMPKTVTTISSAMGNFASGVAGYIAGQVTGAAHSVAGMAPESLTKAALSIPGSALNVVKKLADMTPGMITNSASSASAALTDFVSGVSPQKVTDAMESANQLLNLLAEAVHDSAQTRQVIGKLAGAEERFIPSSDLSGPELLEQDKTKLQKEAGPDAIVKVVKLRDNETLNSENPLKAKSAHAVYLLQSRGQSRSNVATFVAVTSKRLHKEGMIDAEGKLTPKGKENIQDKKRLPALSGESKRRVV